MASAQARINFLRGRGAPLRSYGGANATAYSSNAFTRGRRLPDGTNMFIQPNQYLSNKHGNWSQELDDLQM